MARITKKETKLCTRDEADAIIRNADGAVRFAVMVSAFLPTDETHGFEGCTFISVSKKEARRIASNLLSPTMQERGARIRLHLEPPDPELSMTSRANITIY